VGGGFPFLRSLTEHDGNFKAARNGLAFTVLDFDSWHDLSASKYLGTSGPFIITSTAPGGGLWLFIICLDAFNNLTYQWLISSRRLYTDILLQLKDGLLDPRNKEDTVMVSEDAPLLSWPTSKGLVTIDNRESSKFLGIMSCRDIVLAGIPFA
jgi:hypothetical protein